VTERAHGGLDMGTDTVFGRLGFLTRWTCPSAQPDGRSWLWADPVHMGTGTMSGIPIRNVQRPTFNSQLSMGDRKGAWWADMGTDTISEQERGQTRYLARVFGRRTCPTTDGRCWGTRIWGQARCPVYRSGTFNVQRSTLNFQWDDRKGAWWAGYGDRHGIWATGLLTRRT
jgi:hypothetical protein